jgi:cytochrome c-type biogenesis protein CcmH
VRFAALILLAAVGTLAAGAASRASAASTAGATGAAGAAGAAGTAGVAGAAPAVTDAHGQLEDPALQARFEHIAGNLRCLVCQNESIADSNAELAADLRRQVRELLVAGKSDQVIYAYMTDRYGDFVRFNPALGPKTLLIWGAPFLMIAAGGFIVYRIARQRARLPIDTAD